MSKRTEVFQVLPWLGGLVTARDPILLTPQELSKANDIIFSTDGSRRKRGGFQYFDSSAISGTPKIIGGIDYWANVSSSKIQKQTIVTDAAEIYYLDSAGNRTQLTLAAGSSALITGYTTVVFEVINEDLVFAFNNASTPKKWDGQIGTEYEDLGGTPPNFSFCKEHKNRLFAAGVLSNPDRLYYSSLENHEEWNGAGTSGAIDIGIGDGDPEGITAIFPTIKGQLFVAKREKLYRVDTTDPDDTNWIVTPVSDGIGCIGHNSVVAVGQDDVVFASDRGFHSLVATDKFGDFESSFISKDIQKSFIKFNKAQYKQVWGSYLPEINSIAFAVAEEGFSRNNAIYLFNIETKGWYRWTSNACDAMWVAKFGGEGNLMLGDNAGRIKRFNDRIFNDEGSAISFNTKTGLIYPDNSSNTIKGFKNVSILYRPKGTYTLTAKFKIDNYDEQTLTFNLTGGFDALGTDFVLGTSVLGYAGIVPTVTLPVDGYGHGFTLELIQNGLNQDAEIYGFSVEFEKAGDSQEAPELS